MKENFFSIRFLCFENIKHISFKKIKERNIIANIYQKLFSIFIIWCSL